MQRKKILYSIYLFNSIEFHYANSFNIKPFKHNFIFISQLFFSHLFIIIGSAQQCETQIWFNK
jgi:hypothetical protein